MSSIGENRNVAAAQPTNATSGSQPAAIGGTIIPVRHVSNSNNVLAINPRHPDTASLRTYLDNTNPHTMNDVTLLPLLVKRANDEVPGRNIYLARSFDLFCNMIRKLKTEGVESARFIVSHSSNPKQYYLDTQRCAVVDYSLKEGKASLIGIEPEPFYSFFASGIGNMLSKTASGVNDIAFTMIESELPIKDSEFAMYGLLLAKEMHQEQAHFAGLHDQNREGKLGPGS